MRNTLTPIEGAVLGKLAVKALFDPNPIPETFAEFPASLSLRPSQLRASAEDGLTLRRWAERNRRHYCEIEVPVMIVAGDADRAVSYRAHSRRLHHDIPGSQLRIWPETGHMVHHSRSVEVIEAIEEVFRMADERAAIDRADSPVDASEASVAP